LTVVIDHATPASNLVNVVVETVCRDGDHLNDLSERDLPVAERNRGAFGVPGELQDCVVG
jgi:hypothetical protein